MSPGGREMVTSGGEREERRAWTPDRDSNTLPAPLKEHTSMHLPFEGSRA